MKNSVVVRVNGININRFINKVIKNNINIYNIDKVSTREIILEIDSLCLEQLMTIKGIYNIEVISYVGLNKYKSIFKDNFIIYICLIISIIFIVFLSNFIFDIKVYHNNSSLKKLILNELKTYGVKPGSYRKSFDQIERIKEEILKKYKLQFEWIEITRVGTLYEVRFEERIINNDKRLCEPQNIIANKSAVIKKIFATSGVIAKNENEYVSSGEVIISGNIYLNDKLMSMVCADGVIYGETWYTVKINYPLHYVNKSYTGNKKTVFNVSFFNNDFNFFNFNKYKTYDKIDDVIYSNKILPLKVSLQHQRETNVIDKNYSYIDAYNAAIDYATLKMDESLDNDEYIISKKVLKNEQKDSTIYMEMFFKVYENITGKEIITPPEENRYD